MIAGMAVVLHEGRDLGFEIAGQVVVRKQDSVLSVDASARSCPGRRMIGRSADMLMSACPANRQIARDVRRAVVRQKPRPVNDVHLIEAGGRQRQIERGGHILRFHRGAELPGDNEAREVVQLGGEIVPAPARDLEIGEVSLPELVGRRGLVLERLGRFDNDIGRAGDQIVRFREADKPSLRRKRFCLVREASRDRQFPRAEFRLNAAQVDNLAADSLWDTVPDPIRP